MPLDFRKIEEKKTRGIDGVWLDYIDGTEKEGDAVTRIKVARSGGKQFQAFVQGKLSAIKKFKKGADIEDALMDPRMEPVYREAYARFVLLDWQHVFGPNGEETAYNADLGMQAFEDPDFFAFVRTVSGDSETYREESVEADAGN